MVAESRNQQTSILDPGRGQATSRRRECATPDDPDNPTEPSQKQQTLEEREVSSLDGDTLTEESADHRKLHLNVSHEDSMVETRETNDLFLLVTNANADKIETATCQEPTRQQSAAD